jgi:hypothetical protein
MTEELQRTEQDGLSSLEIHDCRIDVPQAVARAAGVDVTASTERRSPASA